MKYYHKRVLENSTFKEALDRTREALKQEGFGILTEIDISATLKKKLGVDFNPYIILGACNPPFAYKALQLENKIGTMLPCNVIVQEIAPKRIEIAAIDPEVSMETLKNDQLTEVAGEVNKRLQRVLVHL